MAERSLTALDSMFSPRAVAVIGSVKKGKIAHQIITQLREGGFEGNIWAVNPKGESPEVIADSTHDKPSGPERRLSGRRDEGYVPGVRSVGDISEPVDLAVICSPAATVAGVLEVCGRQGVAAAVVITSGFGEIGRRAEEEELLKIAGRSGIRLIGPNCAGIMSPGARLFASIEVRALPGNVAFITQSGAVGGAVLAMAEARGIGFSRFVSYGNRIDIGETELLQYLTDDSETGAVALYVESLQDGRAFMAAARELTRNKPLIIIKAGRTDAGSRAAGSHTGSLAGSDAVFNAMVKKIGAVRAAGLEEMLDLCQGFTMMPPVRGKRLAIVTNSGGPGILTTDRAEELGLDVSVPGLDQAAALKKFLPGHASVSNPVDLTVEGTEEGFRKTLEILLSDAVDDRPAPYDCAIAINVATPFLDSSGLAGGIADGAEHTGKPVAAVFMSGRIVESGVQLLTDRRVPVFPTGERAAVVLAAMAEYEEYRSGDRRINLEPEIPQAKSPDGQFVKKGASRTPRQPAAAQPEPVTLQSDRPCSPVTLLTSPVLMPDALALLKEYGFCLPRYRFIAAGEDFVGTGDAQPGQRAKYTGNGRAETVSEDLTADLHFPLAMKVVSPSIIHKSDAGGVALNLHTAGEVREAFIRMHTKLSSHDFRGVVLHEMIPQGVEIILGMKRDPTFGPVIAAGAGGIYTEILRDVSLRIAPVDESTALEQLRELKIHPLLTGFRGAARLDIESLARQIVLLSKLALDHPEITELDLNPLFVLEKNAVAGDVHIHVEEKDATP